MRSFVSKLFWIFSRPLRKMINESIYIVVKRDCCSSRHSRDGNHKYPTLSIYYITIGRIHMHLETKFSWKECQSYRS